jgi:hypothetical protein
MKFAKIEAQTYPMTTMSAVVEFQAQVKDGMIQNIWLTLLIK